MSCHVLSLLSLGFITAPFQKGRLDLLADKANCMWKSIAIIAERFSHVAHHLRSMPKQ